MGVHIVLWEFSPVDPLFLREMIGNERLLQENVACIPAVPWAFHPRLHHTIASRHKDVLSNLEVHFHVDPSFWIGLSFICS